LVKWMPKRKNIPEKNIKQNKFPYRQLAQLRLCH
jgi:hypothetical protein